jgi:RNA polymerase sigma-70 factor (ECF subfamily)
MAEHRAPVDASVFVAALPERARALLTERELRSWLDASVEAALDAWPEVDVPLPEFLPYLAAKIGALKDPRLFPTLKAADLYLAVGCAQGRPPALAAFAEHYFPQVERTVRGMGLPLWIADDLQGILREKLFLEKATGACLIHRYSGRGELKHWFRSITVHAALRLLRSETRHNLLAYSPEPALRDSNPELTYLQRFYAVEFISALTDALRLFSRRERSLLRRHYVHGLSVDDMGAHYGVHRATAARWVANVREALIASVRRLLVERLSLEPNEIDGVLGLARSDPEMSITQLLLEAV